MQSEMEEALPGPESYASTPPLLNTPDTVASDEEAGSDSGSESENFAYGSKSSRNAARITRKDKSARNSAPPGFQPGFVSEFEEFPISRSVPYKAGEPTYLFMLPNELLAQIFGEFSAPTFNALARTCKRLLSISKSTRRRREEGHIEIDYPQICTCSSDPTRHNVNSHLYQRLAETKEVKEGSPVRNILINLRGVQIPHQEMYLPLRRRSPEDLCDPKEIKRAEGCQCCGLLWRYPLEMDYWNELNADFHPIREHLEEVRVRIEVGDTEEKQERTDRMNWLVDTIIDVLCRNCCGGAARKVRIQILTVTPRFSRLVAHTCLDLLEYNKVFAQLAGAATHLWMSANHHQANNPTIQLAHKFPTYSRHLYKYYCSHNSLHPHSAGEICHYQSLVIAHRLPRSPPSDDNPGIPLPWQRLPISFHLIENPRRTPLAYIQLEGIRAAGSTLYRILKQARYDRGTVVFRNCSIMGKSRQFSTWEVIVSSVKGSGKGGWLRYCRLEELAGTCGEEGEEVVVQKWKMREWERLLMAHDAGDEDAT